MSTKNIFLRGKEDVWNISTIISRYPFPVEFVSGSNHVDARSPMGLFTLDFSQPIVLIAHTSEDAPFFEDIKEFIV